jgi:hypothetical protein
MGRGYNIKTYKYRAERNENTGQFRSAAEYFVNMFDSFYLNNNEWENEF